MGTRLGSTGLRLFNVAKVGRIRNRVFTQLSFGTQSQHVVRPALVFDVGDGIVYTVAFARYLPGNPPNVAKAPEHA